MPRERNEQTGAPRVPPRAHERILGSVKTFLDDREAMIPAILSVVMLITLVVAVFSAVQVLSLRDRIRSMENSITALTEKTTSLQPGWVDSSFHDVQPLGLGFSLVDFTAEPVDTGVRVTGAIINGSSLDHSDAVFTVFLTEKRQAKLTIASLKAGHSAPFEVVIGPATDRSVPKKIRILFAGSTVSYY
jgi:hypothetical protein